MSVPTAAPSASIPRCTVSAYGLIDLPQPANALCRQPHMSPALAIALCRHCSVSPLLCVAIALCRQPHMSPALAVAHLCCALHTSAAQHAASAALSTPLHGALNAPLWRRTRPLCASFHAILRRIAHPCDASCNPAARDAPPDMCGACALQVDRERQLERAAAQHQAAQAAAQAAAVAAGQEPPMVPAPRPHFGACVPMHLLCHPCCGLCASTLGSHARPALRHIMHASPPRKRLSRVRPWCAPVTRLHASTVCHGSAQRFAEECLGLQACARVWSVCVCVCVKCVLAWLCG